MELLENVEVTVVPLVQAVTHMSSACDLKCVSEQRRVTMCVRLRALILFHCVYVVSVCGHGRMRYHELCMQMSARTAMCMSLCGCGCVCILMHTYYVLHVGGCVTGGGAAVRATRAEAFVGAPGALALLVRLTIAECGDTPEHPWEKGAVSRDSAFNEADPSRDENKQARTRKTRRETLQAAAKAFASVTGAMP